MRNISVIIGLKGVSYFRNSRYERGSILFYQAVMDGDIEAVRKICRHDSEKISGSESHDSMGHNEIKIIKA